MRSLRRTKLSRKARVFGFEQLKNISGDFATLPSSQCAGRGVSPNSLDVVAFLPGFSEFREVCLKPLTRVCAPGAQRCGNACRKFLGHTGPLSSYGRAPPRLSLPHHLSQTFGPRRNRP